MPSLALLPLSLVFAFSCCLCPSCPLCLSFLYGFSRARHWSCYLRSQLTVFVIYTHVGGQPVERKLIRTRAIPNGSTSYTDLCLRVPPCMCVCHQQPCFSDQKKKTSNLEAYVRWFNRLCYLVATEICMVSRKCWYTRCSFILTLEAKKQHINYTDYATN